MHTRRIVILVLLVTLTLLTGAISRLFQTGITLMRYTRSARNENATVRI